ncbi:Proline transporter 2 [Linum perenne]
MAAHVVFNDDGQMMLPCFIAIAGVLYGLFAITTLHLSVTRVWLGVSTILNFIYIDVPFLFSINEGINTPVTAYSIPGTTTNKKFTTIGTSAKPVFAFNTGIIPEIQATIKQSVVKKMMKALYYIHESHERVFRHQVQDTWEPICDSQLDIQDRSLKATMQGFTEKIVQMMKNKKLFASQDGPDILSQIENEYGRESKAYSAAGHSYINRATTQAIELDTEVPWVRCKADDASDTIVRDTDSNLTTPIYYDPSDITKSPLVTLEQLNAALTETQNQEHVTTLGVSPKSPKSCVSALHSATPQSSKQAANSKDKFKVAAIQFNEDDQDELSDDVPLATMRKRLKRRRCQISDDE